ncbi:hypothetical protein M378DRAFT_178583 [Amanita muscaria Koide BX008]|uniref:DUF8190 domain-containing protein n=1 Tax=Amanita muscaria (strain Koide BX008) TaxID=946122 RepID=A0A0C2WSV7_AMAMK|nr:hypothetical protein M378DRAFT_178583 [Amanita muscaria Koide BX008]
MDTQAQLIEPQHHFDVAHAPAHLEAEDQPHQNITLTAALCADAAAELQMERFRRQTKRTVKLDELAMIYRRSDERKALTLLTHRHEISLADSAYVTEHDEEMLAWDVKSHFLDLMICVGNGLGLAADVAPSSGKEDTVMSEKHYRIAVMFISCMLKTINYRGITVTTPYPDVTDDTEFNFATTAIRVRSILGIIGIRLWERNDGKSLENNPKSSALDFGGCENDTQCHSLSSQQALKTSQSRVRSTSGVFQVDKMAKHPNNRQWKPPKVDEPSRRILLNLDAMKRLDDSIQHLYHQWINDAPAGYFDDDFFTSRVPVAITSRFGQNQQLACTREEELQERTNWRQERDYSRIRYITFAVASHIGAREVRQWRSMEVEEIMEQMPEDCDGVYTTGDPAERTFLSWDDLDELPPYDSTGKENRVYCEDGFLVPRRKARFSPSTKRHGILVDLRHVKELFHLSYDEAAMLVDHFSPVEAYTYPQAGLKIAGHFQANGVMRPFFPFVEKVNKVLSQEKDSDSDDGMNHTPPPITKIVHGVASQGYNAVMHSTRGDSAQHHDAQLGLITGALAGCWASGRTHEKTARRLQRRCAFQLPHVSFSQKIENPEILRDLRLENVFYIDVSQMQPEDKNGGAIVKKIIHPLAFAWNHPSILDEIKQRVILFKPEAYPAIYNWTTFPLTRVLRRVWRVGQDFISSKRQPCPTLIELSSALERALNFMHTGNVAVIATSAMNPLWIGLAIIHDGLPCLNPALVPTLIGPNFVNVEYWPQHDNRLPKSASRCSQLRTYGEGHYNVFFAHLAMATLNSNHLPLFLRDSNDCISLANAIAYHALSLFIQDCKNLVSAAVSSSISNQINSDDPVEVLHGKGRKEALAAWLKSSAPLSWTAGDSSQTRAYLQLLVILNEDHQRRPKPLQQARESWTYTMIAKRMLFMKTAASAPVSPHGTFLPVIALAHERMVLVACKKDDRDHPSVVVSDIFAKIMSKMNIHFVPWHKSDGTKTRAYAARHDWWLFLTSAPMAEINRSAPTEPQAPQDVLEEVLDLAMSLDPNAPWSLPPTLQEMGTFWNKKCLPSDWSLGNASIRNSKPEDPKHYIQATYEYVQKRYSATCWWHHMGLVWAILFSKAVPFVFFDKEERLCAGPFTDAIRLLEWHKRKSKFHGGCSAPLPYITMVSTTIIALLEPDSPLSHYIKRHKNALGDPWTHKHGNKEIHTVNLIRIGIAKAIGTSDSCLQSAKFRKNWDIKTMAELKPLYEKVIGYLTSPTEQFGEYLAMSTVFGEKVAIRAAMRGEMKMPDFITHKEIKVVQDFDNNA